MWTSDEFVNFGQPEEDSSLDGSSPDSAFTPLAFDSLTAIDTDGDGVFETMIVQEGDDITLVYDLDGDGITDFQTDFTDAGEPVSWRDERDEDGEWHWRRIPGGE